MGFRQTTSIQLHWNSFKAINSMRISLVSEYLKSAAIRQNEFSKKRKKKKKKKL